MSSTQRSQTLGGNQGLIHLGQVHHLQALLTTPDSEHPALEEDTL